LQGTSNIALNALSALKRRTRTHRCINVAPLRCANEQLKRRRLVNFDAFSIEIHLRQINRGAWRPKIGRTSKQLGRALHVLLHNRSLAIMFRKGTKRSAVILVRRFLDECEASRNIHRDPVALDQHFAVSELRGGFSFLGSCPDFVR
jgi:hypothetical protein